MKFKVYQTFETLGHSCAEFYESRQHAEQAQAKMRSEIAEMVAGWPCHRDEDDHSKPTGYVHEIEAFEEAEAIAGPNRKTYGRKAGDYIASIAVVIEECEDDESSNA